MANLLQLSDGTDTVDFYDRTVGGMADGGHDLGSPGSSPRTLKLRAKLFNSTTLLTLTQLEANIGKIRRLLAKAERTTALGLPRQVALTVQPDTLAAPTRYYVLSGAVEPVAPWQGDYLQAHIYNDLGIVITVEPWGYGAEQSLVSSGTLYGRASIDARFVATGASGTGVVGTVAGANTAPLNAGSLAQNNKLTTSPTLTTLANQVAFYFGCTFATFDRLVLGIETAKTGTWSGVWEIMTGAATFAGIATTSEFRSGAESTEFDTVRRLGQILITGSTAAWTSQTVGGIAAFWLRYRVTSFTSGLAPIMMNGPVRSLTNLAAVSVGAVPGDQEAAALVHLTNPSATALAGVKATIVTGDLATVPPPMVIDLSGADLYIPTGDTTVATTADANANDGERVDLTLLASIADRSQTLDGAAEYITMTPTGADKLATMSASSNGFFVEVLFKLSSDPTGPVCLASQWSGTLSTSTWWLGIDGGNLRFIVVNQSGKRFSVNGNSAIAVGEWVLATGEFDSNSKHIIVRRDGDSEKRVGVTNIANGKTTAVRMGKSSGFSTSDSRDGDAEAFFPGTIANVRCVGRRTALEHPDGYTWPEIGTAIQNDTATTRWLLRMEDNAASTVITDSSVLFAAAKNAARSAANTSTRSQVGYFQAGVGQTGRVLGLNLPRTWGEEYRGRVRFLLRATPAATLTTVDDVLFQLQLNVGDSLLPMGPPARFPNIAVPSSGYYLLDLGTYQLPPVALRYAGFGNALTSSRNVLQATLFVQHQFVTSTVLRLDCLYLLPVSTFYGEYSSFRTTYDTAYDIEQNTGILFDNLGPEYVIGQTTTTGYTDQARSPFADVGGSGRCILRPNAPAWLFTIPLRGVTSGPDYLVHVLGDSLTPLVRAVGRYEALAAS